MKSTLEVFSAIDMDTAVAGAATLLVTIGGLMSLSLLITLVCRLLF